MKANVKRKLGDQCRNTQILFEDYGRENKPFLRGILSNIARVANFKDEFEHEEYIRGFELEFARFNGSRYAVGVNSGTTALELSLKALGISDGDEVIVPAYTYIATALAVSNTGAVPIFADIDEHTLTLDTKTIEKKITGKTKAVIPVHIHGNPCDMEGILKAAKKHGLKIIEDASHAHGAEYRNVKVGNFGVGCFSNHNSKVLSGMGNSGVITTNDANIYRSLKMMLASGDGPKGTLSKRSPCAMDAVQAAVLIAKLPCLEELADRRRKIASLYAECFSGSIGIQKEENRSRHVYRDFIILSPKRQAIRNRLQQDRIETKIRYRAPAHLLAYYGSSGYKKGDLPVTERTIDTALCLPISPFLSGEEVKYICAKVKASIG